MIVPKTLISQLGKILGFEDEYIQKLEKDYSLADEDGRYQIMDTLWKYFFELYEKLTDLKYSQFLKEVALGKRKLASNLYQQAQIEVKEYFLKILTGEVADEEKIEEIRKKIIEMMAKIN